MTPDWYPAHTLSSQAAAANRQRAADAANAANSTTVKDIAGRSSAKVGTCHALPSLCSGLAALLAGEGSTL